LFSSPIKTSYRAKDIAVSKEHRPPVPGFFFKRYNSWHMSAYIEKYKYIRNVHAEKPGGID
jgi:hypothetical protein